ncbi:MAG: 50S ribosomal protein L35 [Phycisphaerales bacterium]|jgi:large subunit ribosomal protein L35|nr:50S ribosomal protein L35 [Phycisphaerales bacterium]
MAYKFKPNKSVLKRFRVSKTGKVKRGHSFRSHLLSGRSSKKKRHLRRSAILFEGHARNMREMIGMSGRRPNQIAHERALDAKNQAENTQAE